MLKLLQIKLKWGPVATGLTLICASLIFWACLRKFTHWNPALFVSLSLASLMVGAVAGFLFTSYGDEAATVGKIRDWLIGGLAGLSIAKFSTLKSLLLTFASDSGPQPYALAVAVAIIFATLGFFAMFFQRELILNVLLAESRDRRGRVDGTKVAGIVSHELVALLPPTVLAGIEDIDDDLAASQKPEATRLRERLQSDEVKQFLKQCEDACLRGGALDWEVVSKAAMLNYYLVYFADQPDKEAQRHKAMEWLTRALLMNPGHTDFTTKYADVLAQAGSESEAILILERLDQNPEAPAYVRQWLGYYLLFVDRYDDAIKYSEEYHERFPDETAALFNAANGYARKYELAMRQPTEGKQAIADADTFRRKAISAISTALKIESAEDLTETKTWVKTTPSFSSLRDDPQFKTLVSTDSTSTAS